MADVPAAVARYLAGERSPARGVCWPESAPLDWGGAGLEHRSAARRDGDDKVGITGTYCALAETGTLMLLSGPDTHATTSLCPRRISP